jgi:hypothetical protein
MDSAIHISVIANERKRGELFGRLDAFCEKNNAACKMLQNEPYWKIDGLFELGIEISPAPIWNYGAWSAAYRFLFEQEFTIEWEANGDISLCYYPAYDDRDSYFVIFHIPSRNFLPKPSKTIRH